MPPLSSLIAALDAYWYVVVAIAVFLLACWRALPLATRDAIEQRFPRFVGAVRVLYAILPDLVGAGRALRIQIVEGQPKRKGFARLGVLVPVALVCFVAALALQGCPLPPQDGCTPMATRCSPQGKPQRCSASGRWWSEPASQPCAAVGATCCLAMSPFGNAVHACLPQGVCLPEVTDAAAAVDAVLEGGAQ